MINIKVFTEEISGYKDKGSIYDKLLELKDCYLGNNSLKKSEKEIYSLSLIILEQLFNPMNQYNEPIIPLSFLQSELGKTLLAIINDNDKRLLTVNDVVEMSKTKSNKKGYSHQYIHKEIKNGKLPATMYNGRWQISYEEAKKFLEKRKKI
ncbi:helix-turn-helix domain-containing protein (plasmid) [Clostridium beijerinckii]|uniref:helix-turn-helix domain-containing protein n=1 Tax=Clostridium beijerinckii TaxID=1520 RepID=UPI002226FEEE|nr:helix-turn-helix domain-containing protein [Clostridium beijerinckii]UYZ39101.1 helix-turn-helix domain-containing protein [Clostridium beijerinckii]